MPKLKDIAVVVGTYQKDGKETFKWKTVGALIENNGKQYIMLDRSFNPAGTFVEKGRESSDQIVMSLFEPKGYDKPADKPQQKSSYKRPSVYDGDDTNDDIPF